MYFIITWLSALPTVKTNISNELRQTESPVLFSFDRPAEFVIHVQYTRTESGRLTFKSTEQTEVRSWYAKRKWTTIRKWRRSQCSSECRGEMVTDGDGSYDPTSWRRPDYLVVRWWETVRCATRTQVIYVYARYLSHKRKQACLTCIHVVRSAMRRHKRA